MEEIWKPIPGYEGRYEASNLGRIRGLDRWVERRGQKPLFVRGQILRPVFAHETSYAQVNLSGKTRLVHHLVAEAFLGPRPRDAEVRHLDGCRSNNRVSNLAYGTRAENLHDCYQYGSHTSGGKLLKEDVLYIREQLALGVKQKVLCQQFGVSRTTIRNIKIRKTHFYF